METTPKWLRAASNDVLGLFGGMEFQKLWFTPFRIRNSKVNRAHPTAVVRLCLWKLTKRERDREWMSGKYVADALLMVKELSKKIEGSQTTRVWNGWAQRPGSRRRDMCVLF